MKTDLANHLTNQINYYKELIKNDRVRIKNSTDAGERELIQENITSNTKQLSRLKKQLANILTPEAQTLYGRAYKEWNNIGSDLVQCMEDTGSKIKKRDIGHGVFQHCMDMVEGFRDEFYKLTLTQQKALQGRIINEMDG